jgi:hypothetical protein
MAPIYRMSHRPTDVPGENVDDKLKRFEYR